MSEVNNQPNELFHISSALEDQKIPKPDGHFLFAPSNRTNNLDCSMSLKDQWVHPPNAGYNG